MPLNASTPTEAVSGAVKHVRAKLAQGELLPQEQELDQVWVQRAQRQMRRKENWDFGCFSSAAVSFQWHLGVFRFNIQGQVPCHRKCADIDPFQNLKPFCTTNKL